MGTTIKSIEHVFMTTRGIPFAFGVLESSYLLHCMFLSSLYTVCKDVVSTLDAIGVNASCSRDVVLFLVELLFLSA